MAKTFNIKRKPNAPEFVIGSFGMKYEELQPFVNDKGYINFDILESKEGKQYIKINDFKPKDKVDF